MILSLRTRLLLGIVIGTALLLMVFSVLVYSITERRMIRNFDTSLLGMARMLSGTLEEEDISNEDRNGHQDEFERIAGSPDRKIEFDFNVHMIPEFNNINGGAYYQIWGADGKSLVRSPSLGTENLDVFQSGSRLPAYRDITLPDKKRGRAVSYPFVPRIENESWQNVLPQDHPLTVVLAQRADTIYDHLDFLQWLLSLTSVGVVFLSAGIAFFVTRASLYPVHSLAGMIMSVREDDLGKQFPLDQYPAELAPICQCLNDLFRRLEESFNREKQFNANVTHEMRTPLAGMQSIIEVCLARPRGSEEYRLAFADCLHVVRTMNKMIDTLLMLSRVEAGQITIQTEPVNLNILIDEVWRFFADTAHDRDIVFENMVGHEAVCQSDKTHLAMILSNILHNAADYTNPGGRIWAASERSDGAMMISICNTGCELTADDAAHLFDLFWRKSRSRTDAGRHCGIGLSVAHQIASILDIQILVNVKDDVFGIQIVIPI